MKFVDAVQSSKVFWEIGLANTFPAYPVSEQIDRTPLSAELVALDAKTGPVLAANVFPLPSERDNAGIPNSLKIDRHFPLTEIAPDCFRLLPICFRIRGR